MTLSQTLRINNALDLQLKMTVQCAQVLESWSELDLQVLPQPIEDNVEQHLTIPDPVVKNPTDFRKSYDRRFIGGKSYGQYGDITIGLSQTDLRQIISLI